MKFKYLLASFFTLIAGITIYLLFRPASLKVFSWLDYLNIDFINSDLRKTAFRHHNLFPDWFLYALPDGLWIFSYVSLMLCIWNFRINVSSLFWISIVPLVAIFSELGQLFHMVPGTFDTSDLLFYCLGMVLPLLIIFKKNNINFIKFHDYEQKF